jgi:preprotein translocase subunit SecF
MASKYAKNWAIGAILTGVAIAVVLAIINGIYYGLAFSGGSLAEQSTSSNSYGQTHSHNHYY